MKVFEDGEINLKHRQKNELKEIHNKDLKNMYRMKDKSDHGTIEQCIDPRISRIIEKYKKRGQITEFNGCIATGKEANVYHARGTGEFGEKLKEKEWAIRKTISSLNCRGSARFLRTTVSRRLMISI